MNILGIEMDEYGYYMDEGFVVALALVGCYNGRTLKHEI
jgi:hypothetical protein